MSISREDYAEFHETREYLRASEAGYYDRDDDVTCASCGCTIPRDEAEPIDHMKFCVDCAPAYRLLKAISR